MNTCIRTTCCVANVDSLKGVCLGESCRDIALISHLVFVILKASKCGKLKFGLEGFVGGLAKRGPVALHAASPLEHTLKYQRKRHGHTLSLLIFPKA